MLGRDGWRWKTEPTRSHDQQGECACRGGKGRKGRERRSAPRLIMVLHSSTPPVTLTLTLTPASALRQPLASSDALCCPVEAFLEESRYGASSFSIERGNASLITAYSLLACQGLWCYKGLDSGAMNLSTVFFSCRVSYRLRDSILFGFCKVFIEPDEHAAACLPLGRENTPPPSSCVRLPSNRGFGLVVAFGNKHSASSS